jgi:hypothetical protein
MKPVRLFAISSAVLLALGGLLSRVQAQTPDFQCPMASVCAFSGTQFNDTHSSYGTSTHSNAWVIPSWVGFHNGNPNPKWINSINDNSGSIVWVAWFNTVTGWHNEKCFEPGKESDLNAGAGADNFAAALYIEYGVISCLDGHKPSLPK